MDTNLTPMPEDLRLRYISRRTKDIQDYPSRLLARDWAYFERLGHQLKGNAPSYGFSDLGQIALRIERSALERNMTDLEQHLNDFRNWIEQHQQ